MHPTTVKNQEIRSPNIFPKDKKIITINTHSGSIGNILSTMMSKHAKIGPQAPIELINSVIHSVISITSSLYSIYKKKASIKKYLTVF